MITACTLQDALEADMKVFSHLIYEYEKGVRNLVLYTIPGHLLPLAEDKLEKRQIDFFVQPVRNRDSVNVFFGQCDCIATMKHLLSGRTIDDLSPEEDFILGALLGYDLCKQCKRYCNRTETLLERDTLLAAAI